LATSDERLFPTSSSEGWKERGRSDEEKEKEEEERKNKRGKGADFTIL
jgi:hypothetical protein